MSMIPEKAQWPGWETVRLIGRGSFGGVYEIQRKIFDETETAALKVISVPQSSGDIDELYSVGYDEESITEAFKDQLKGIVNEYSLMRKLNGCHNIVSCDDVRYVQQDNGYGWDIYIKMELLTPLLKALPAQIPEQTVIRVAKDLCSALDWCKRYNIIHRDIKPQNIFVSEAGDYKLGDFGIAKTVEKTSGGTRIGTYKYIAPEVFYNQPYGSAADIYSLGLTLYWMLNERRMPFLPLPPAKLTVGMEEEARQRRLSGQPLPAPWNGSERLKAIVLKACAYSPADRYQSAREMLDDLNALDEPVFRPVDSIPAEAAEEDAEGTALLDGEGQTALLNPEEEQTGLMTPEEEPQEKPYGFVEGTVLMEEDDTLLMPQEEEPKRDTQPVEEPNNKKAEHTPEPEKEPVNKGGKGWIWGVCAAILALVVFVVMMVPKEHLLKPDCVQMIAESGELVSMPVYGSKISRNQIGSITFVDELRKHAPFYLDISTEQDKSIQVYFDERADGLYDMVIACEGIIKAPRDCTNLFALYTNAQSIDFGDHFDTSGVNNMHGMFAFCQSLKTLDLSGFETHSVMRMDWMFMGCDALENVNLSSFRTGNVTNMASMFQHCLALETLDLSSFNTQRVTQMNGMFAHCRSLKSLDLSGFYTSQVTEMDSMFYCCEGLMAWNASKGQYDAFLNIGNWNVRNVGTYAGFLDRSDGSEVYLFGQPWRAFFEDYGATARKTASICTTYTHTIALGADGSMDVFSGTTNTKMNAFMEEFAAYQDLVSVSASVGHVVGLKKDGTVVAAGENGHGECNVQNWTDIIAVAANSWLKIEGEIVTGDEVESMGHTVGLRKDGTVVATGDNSKGQCDVADWTDVKQIIAGQGYTLGLRYDGTVLYAGNSTDAYPASVIYWQGIVKLASSGGDHLVGLRADGTVVEVGYHTGATCYVAGWTDIVDISSGKGFTVGLRSDGTVVATGNNDWGQCDVAEWTDIIDIEAGGYHTVGLRADGTVVAVGDNGQNQCYVSGLTDVIQIAAGDMHTAVLTKDGYVIIHSMLGPQLFQANVEE